MSFLVKSHRPSFLLFLNCCRAKEMRFEKVFDNLTFKHMDAWRKQFQCLVNYFLNHCFSTYAVLSKF